MSFSFAQEIKMCRNVTIFKEHYFPDRDFEGEARERQKNNQEESGGRMSGDSAR